MSEQATFVVVRAQWQVAGASVSDVIGRIMDAGGTVMEAVETVGDPDRVVHGAIEPSPGYLAASRAALSGEHSR